MRQSPIWRKNVGPRGLECGVCGRLCKAVVLCRSANGAPLFVFCLPCARVIGWRAGAPSGRRPG